MTTAAVRSARTRKNAAKKDRTIRLLARLSGNAGLFQVTEGKDVARYFYREVPADYGTGFLVEK